MGSVPEMMGDVTRAEVAALVRLRAAQLTGRDPTTLAADARFLGELGVDSLDFVEFVLALEDELGIELPEHEMAGVSTPDQLAALAASKLNPDGGR